MSDAGQTSTLKSGLAGDVEMDVFVGVRKEERKAGDWLHEVLCHNFHIADCAHPADEGVKIAKSFGGGLIDILPGT